MNTIKEINNYDEFNSFKTENSFCIIKLGAEWCGPCRTLVNTLNNLDKERINNISIAEVDIENDEVENIITEFSVRNIPVTLFFKDGNLVEKKVGLISANDIYNIIELHK